MPLHVEEAEILLCAQFDCVKLLLNRQPAGFAIGTVGALGSMVLSSLKDDNERRQAVMQLVRVWKSQIEGGIFNEDGDGGDLNGKPPEGAWRN